MKLLSVIFSVMVCGCMMGQLPVKTVIVTKPDTVNAVASGKTIDLSGGKVYYETGLSNYISLFDFWNKGILSGDSVDNFVSVKSAALKEYPCWLVSAGPNNIRLTNMASDFILNDQTSVFEYWYDIVITKNATNTNVLVNGTNSNNTAGQNIRWVSTYLFYRIANGTSNITLNAQASDIGPDGYARIYWKVDYDKDSIYFSVNGHNYKAENTLTGSSNSPYLYLGYTSSPEFKVLRFAHAKNGAMLHDFRFSQNQLYDIDIISGGVLHKNTPGVYPSTQSYQNPFPNGYDTWYMKNDTIYSTLNVAKRTDGSSCDVNFLNYKWLSSFTANDYGYYASDYVDFSGHPIMNTTDRGYWKSQIESYPYYMGGTSGKEYYFHREWLNNDWIQNNIVDSVKHKVYAQPRFFIEGADTIINNLPNIVISRSNVSLISQTKSIYTPIDSGRVWISTPLNNNHYCANDIYRNDTSLTMCINEDSRIIKKGNYIKMSIDNGKTYNAGFDFTAIEPIDNVHQVRILENGNVVAFTYYKAYYSVDSCLGFSESPLYGTDGNVYTKHIPVNESYPGGYFFCMNGFDYDGDSVYVFGTYTNSTGGASPVSLYYSKDFGLTWHIFYMFGQSEAHTDNGTTSGGEGGTLLGDPNNDLVTRHIHDVSYSNGYFYAVTGDALGEMHVLKCKYDYSTKTWSVNDLLEGQAINWPRFRGMGFFDDGTKYVWGTDGTSSFTVNGITYKGQGVYSCHYDSLNDVTKHKELIQTDTAFYSFKKYGNTYFGIPFNSIMAVISEDNGVTWSRVLLNNVKYLTGGVNNGAWQTPIYDPTRKRILYMDGVNGRRMLVYLK